MIWQYSLSVAVILFIVSWVSYHLFIPRVPDHWMSRKEGNIQALCGLGYLVSIAACVVAAVDWIWWIAG